MHQQSIDIALEAASRALLAKSLGEPKPTPWGPVAAVVLCLLPVAFLVVVTVVKKLLLPTSISLPLAAVMLAFIRLAYLSSPALLVSAACVSGLLEALTPLSIIAGAIMLFQTMQHTKCLPWMMGQIKSLSAGHPVAEVFLIGFAFAYLVEGASGFGTPVALAAPMLASLGHQPLPTVCCLLVMNTFATQFGAVGTPIWFGFGDIGLGEANLQNTGLQAAIIVGVCTYMVAPLAAAFLVTPRELVRNAVFVVLAISTAVVPSVGIAFFSYEFPTLIGGLVSVLLTGVLVKFKVGLRPVDSRQKPTAAAEDTSDASFAVTKSKSIAAKKRSAVSCATSQESFSFVDDVGVVAHPPVSTLDFPLINDPQQYNSCQRHNFAAQVDENTIAAALSAASATAFDSHGTSHGAAAAAAAAAANGHKCAGTAGDKQPSQLEDSVKSPAVAGSFSSKLQDDLEHGLPAPLVLRSSPSGHMELDPLDPVVAVKGRLSLTDLVLRTMPIWLTVLVLLLTRIPALPIKKTLQSPVPRFMFYLGNFGNFGISASLVVQLQAILSERSVSWKYELLYVPFLLPFALASLITVLVHRKDLEVSWTTPFKEAFQRVAGITVATLGALVLVQLIRTGAAGSPAYIIGYYLSSWLAQGFFAISAFLGALGSFFSGSTTVSNLTFGDIQKVAAERINTSATGMLAVQVAGATIGNMICINNILSAKAVMNMTHVPEGEFIRRTAPLALVMLVLAQAVGLIFTLGGVLPDKPMLNQY